MNHYEPAPCEIVEKYRFNTCDRQPNPNIIPNMALLRQRSEHCNYGDKSEEQLRDNQVRQQNPKTTIVRRQINTENSVEIAMALE